MFHLQVADRIATVVLDRPPVNAMSDTWVAALHALLNELGARRPASPLQAAPERTDSTRRWNRQISCLNPRKRAARSMHSSPERTVS
jgi:hypothetical protein